MECIQDLHNNEGRWAELRWAQYLDVEPLGSESDKEDQTPIKPSGVQWFTTRAKQREIIRAQCCEHREDACKQQRDQLQWLTDETIKNRDLPHTASTPYISKKDENRAADENYRAQWKA